MNNNAYNENCIEWIRDESRATLSLSQKRTISKVEKLALSHPGECSIISRNQDDTICAQVPVSLIKINPTKQLTDEQHEAMAKRLKNNLKPIIVGII